MPKCKHRFAVISRNSQHVRVRVSSSCDNGEQWATNGVLMFTREEWQQFFKWVVALRPGCELIEVDNDAG